MDERHIEMAEQFQEEQLIRAIQRARSAIEAPTGHCLNCDAKVEGTRKFCNSECREDYELRQKTLKNQYA
jgi:RNA polymerase-binding transcription factor DksA